MTNEELLETYDKIDSLRSPDYREQDKIRAAKKLIYSIIESRVRFQKEIREESYTRIMAKDPALEALLDFWKNPNQIQN